MKQDSSNRNKRFLYNRALKIQRTKIKRKHKKYYAPLYIGAPLPPSKTGKAAVNNSFKRHNVKLPKVFSVEKNINGVVEFFAQFSKFKYQGVQHIAFDMSEIVDIDISAIVMFLTKITQLSNDGIRYIGNVPENEKCRLIFEESGFLQHMSNIQGRKFENSNECNLIVKRGQAETESELTGKTIKKAVCKLTGSEKHYTPVQSIVQEMAGNSVEHAYAHNKHWLFCVNVNDDCITFILSDGGKGILKTLNRKYKKVIDAIKLTDNVDILQRAFEKKYNSASDEPNRNKGLPLIKKISDDKKVLDLRVLTNDVYLNLENQNNSKLISSKYSGTLYIWTVTKAILEDGNR